MFLSAQTAAEIETLLGTNTITYAQASRFTLEAASVFITNNPEEAFNYAAQRNWLPGGISANELARLDHISLLLMRSFEVDGGIMYSIFGNSRYAYRELVFRNVIQNRTDPMMLVSGERFLFYINRLLGMEDIQGLVDARWLALQQEPVDVVTRRETLAAEIAEIIAEQAIADTTVEATAEGVLITLSNIMFQADSVELPNSERVKIYEISRILSSIPGIRILIAGHTTNIGEAGYLLELSRGRAQSVADYLVSLRAVEMANITIVGYGGNRPVATNATQEGMAANRRVEIIILEN